MGHCAGPGLVGRGNHAGAGCSGAQDTAVADDNTVIDADGSHCSEGTHCFEGIRCDRDQSNAIHPGDTGALDSVAWLDTAAAAADGGKGKGHVVVEGHEGNYSDAAGMEAEELLACRTALDQARARHSCHKVQEAVLPSQRQRHQPLPMRQMIVRLEEHLTQADHASNPATVGRYEPA